MNIDGSTPYSSIPSLRNWISMSPVPHPMSRTDRGFFDLISSATNSINRRRQRDVRAYNLDFTKPKLSSSCEGLLIYFIKDVYGWNLLTLRE